MDSFPAVQKTKTLPRVTTNGTASTTGNDGQSIGSGYRQYLESEREDEWAVRHNDEIWHGADWCSDATGFYE
jgi:hypothetical protein